MEPVKENKRVPTVSIQSIEQPSPTLVVDLGKKRAKLLKMLRRGEGRLMDDVTHVLGELIATGKISLEKPTAVVFIVSKKRARGKRTVDSLIKWIEA